MKKFITILFLLISCFAVAQPIANRSGQANTVQDARWKALYNAVTPTYNDTIAANLQRGIDSSGAIVYTYNDKSYWFRTHSPKAWVKITNQTDINNIFGCYRLLNGGLVTWDSLLIFHVQPATYIINCKSYTSRDTTLVLSAADSTNPRRDVIAVDTLGRAVVVEGTPSADPAKPQVDLGSQIELTDILVAAGATTPSGVSRTIVYDENLGSPSEWVGSSDIGGGFGTADFNNTSFPYTGVKSASITSAVPMETKYVKFNNGSSVSLTDYQTLSFAIKLKAAILNNAVLSVGLLNGGNYVGNFVNLFNYGLNGGNTNYQVITIPILDFLGGSFSFDEVRFNLKRSGSGFYLDRVQLEGGITSPSNNNFITDIFRKVGTDSVFKVINGNISFAFRDSIGITSIPTWQYTLNVTNGKQLTSNTTIDLNSHDFIWSENNKYEIRDGGGNLNFSIQPATNQAGIGDLDFSITGAGVLVDWGVDSIYYYAFKHLFTGSVRMPSVAAPASTITDTTTYKPIVVDNAGNLKRSAYWYGSGGGTTSLTNIGTGISVGVNNTGNIKKLSGINGVIIDSTTTANTVTLQVDSSKYATKWYAQNNIGYDTTRSGTYAQRLALTGLYPGYQFYQTNQLEGLYIYNGVDWSPSLSPHNYLFNENFPSYILGSGLTSDQSGTGSSGATYPANLVTNLGNDSLHVGLVATYTGTTSSGYGRYYYNQSTNGGATFSRGFITWTEYVIRPVQSGWAGEDVLYFIGDRDTSESVFACMYRYNLNNGKWVFRSKNSIGTPIYINSNVAIDTVLYTSIQFKQYDDDSIQCYINNNYIGTFNLFADISELRAGGVLIQKISGTQNKGILTDRIFRYIIKRN